MAWYYANYYVPYIPETPIAGTYLDGGIPIGASYLYPDVAHACVHVIDADTFDDSKSYNPAPQFHMLYVALSYTGGALIERLGGGDKCYLQELYEQGGGFWMKGMKIDHGSDGANNSLEDYGWKRGVVGAAGGQPIWVVVKKSG
jgi:hypothetical protein